MTISTLQLTPGQLAGMKKIAEDYRSASNAATGSRVDPNANITRKTAASAEQEMMKPFIIQYNRSLVQDYLNRLFGEESGLAESYVDDITNHRIYVHDETSTKPYCASISMYPFLLNGMTNLGGESKAPNHLLSFCGSFINLVLSVSNQLAGAVATVEFLTYFDYFARQELGDDYATYLLNPAMHEGSSYYLGVVNNALQHVVYALNQPVTKGDQAVFWNIAVFDQYFFNEMFGQMVFPEGGRPRWNSICLLQEYFIKWLTKERTHSTLTFPVVTASALVDPETHKYKDVGFADMMASSMAEGSSFFIYSSETVDSLSSCCRLRNAIEKNEFSHSLGAGGIMTGSINVITLNVNRIYQEADRIGKIRKEHLTDILQRTYRYQLAYRLMVQETLRDPDLLPAFSGGFIDLNKQYLTIGVNGVLEASEYVGIEAKNTPEYREFNREVMKAIYDQNRAMELILRESDEDFAKVFRDRNITIKFNTEFVPAENLGVKNAAWDREAGYVVTRDCYNSYFFPVEDGDMSVLDKFSLYDTGMTEFLDGGSALHLNLTEHPNKEQWLKLFDIANEYGVPYWTYNVPSTRCRKCNHRDIRFLQQCPVESCGSTDVVHATRIIGYLKEVDYFSAARQDEYARRSFKKLNI